MKKEKAVIYVRVASQSQIGDTSMKHQEQSCLTYANSRDLKVMGIWKSPDSACDSTTNNSYETSDKSLQKMLKYISTHKDIKNIIVSSTDRIARNMDDSSIIRRLAVKGDVSIHFADTQEVLNKNSSADYIFFFGISCIIAEKYSADASRMTHNVLNPEFEL